MQLLLDEFFKDKAAASRLVAWLKKDGAAARVGDPSTADHVKKAGSLARDRLVDRCAQDTVLLATVATMKSSVMERGTSTIGPKTFDRLLGEVGPVEAFWAVLGVPGTVSLAVLRKAVAALAEHTSDPSEALAPVPRHHPDPARAKEQIAELKEAARAHKAALRASEAREKGCRAQVSSLTRECNALKGKLEAGIAAADEAAQVAAQLKSARAEVKAVGEQHSKVVKGLEAKTAKLESELGAAVERAEEAERRAAEIPGEVARVEGADRVEEVSPAAPQPPDGAPGMAAELSLGDQLAMFRGVVEASVQEVSAAAGGAIDPDDLLSLARLLRELDASTSTFAKLDADAEAAEKADEEPDGSSADAVAPGPKDAAGSSLPRPSRTRGKALTPEQERQWALHDAHRELESREREILARGRPARVLVDGHNMVLRGNDAAEERGPREWACRMLTAMADRLDIDIEAFFDTKHADDTWVESPRVRTTFAASKNGGADHRIIEDIQVPRRGLTLVFTTDLRHIVPEVDDARARGLDVAWLDAETLLGYLVALDRYIECGD